jgi:hypothetical protein
VCQRICEKICKWRFVNEIIEETRKVYEEGMKVYEAQQKRLAKKRKKEEN